MKLITFFWLLFMGSMALLIFIYFNKWMDEQNDNKSFLDEIKEDLFK